MSSLTTLLLCPSCFGQAEGPMIDAARLGTWLLIGVLVSVQMGFVAFFLYLRRQARRSAEQNPDTEWSRYRRKRAVRMVEAR